MEPTPTPSSPDQDYSRLGIVPPSETGGGAESKDKGERLRSIFTAAPVREAISNLFRNATGRIPSRETLGNISSQTASRLWNRKVLGNIAAEMLISGSAGAAARALTLSLGPQGWMVAAAAGGASGAAREIYKQVRERRNEDPNITLKETLTSLNGRRIAVATVRGATIGWAAGEIVGLISHIPGVQNAMGQVGQAVGERLGAAGSAVSGFVRGATGSAGEAGNAVSGIASGVAQAASEGLQSAGNTISGAAGQVPETISGAAQGIGERAGELGRTVSGVTGQLGQTASGLADQALEPVKGVVKIAGQAKDTVTEKAGEVWKGIFGGGTPQTPETAPDFSAQHFGGQEVMDDFDSGQAAAPETVPAAPAPEPSVPAAPQPESVASPQPEIPETPKLEPIPPTTALNGAVVSGSVADGTLTYDGKPWVLLDNGIKNIGNLLQTVGETGTVDQKALANNLQEATQLWVQGELKPADHSDLWKLFHLSNGTSSVFDKLLGEDTLDSLKNLGIIGK